MAASAPPQVRGGIPWVGHMLEYSRGPHDFITSVASCYGEVAAFTLLGQRIVLMTGADASAWFYHASDGQLDPSTAYRVMTPIFGRGVLYDAEAARCREQLAMMMPALRGPSVRETVPTIVAEVNVLTQPWGSGGEVDVVDFMRQLTINTATHCLLGPEFRSTLSEEFARLYADLEAGVRPLAYYFPNLPTPRFRRRDAARRRLQELIGATIAERLRTGGAHTDLLQTLMESRYSDGSDLTEAEVAGILMGVIFAGHHTSAGTAAWLLIELLRHPRTLARVQAEVEAAGELTADTLHGMSVLEASLKEVLRLHPPVMLLMRRARSDLQYRGYRIAAGDLVWTSPTLVHRDADHFADPNRFNPDRFSAHKGGGGGSAYQPFGGGTHRCSGSGFATLQIKVITAELLRQFDFRLAVEDARYVDDHREMIVQPRTPCPVTYRRHDPS